MESATTFGRHFARLVWLMLNESDESDDAQVATLRALVVLSRDGQVLFSPRDWLLYANGTQLPERFTGVQELTAQLIGHSIVDLLVERGSPPADILGIGKLLSTEPVPGDGGVNIVHRIEALGARSIRLKVESLANPRRPAPKPTTGTHSSFAPQPSSSLTPLTPEQQIGGYVAEATDWSAKEGADHAPPSRKDDEKDKDIVREQDPEQFFQTFSAVETPKGSMDKLLAQLDVAGTPPAVGQILDALVQLATESSRKERMDISTEIIWSLQQREEKIEDKTAKRSYGLALRRLCIPQVLKCVTALLPRRRENEEMYMSVLKRAEDAGVEALVDALTAAPSIADRRVYYDALKHMRAGIRTLIFMLGDHRWYVARNAADLLGEMKVLEADAALTRVLEHEDDRVRTAAASALAKLGTTAAAKALRIALRDASPEVRERAAEALGNNRRSATSLVKALQQENDARVQMAIIAALGQIGTPDAVAKLIDIARAEGGIFRRRSTPLRVAAVHALADSHSPSAWSTLAQLQRDKEKDVRGAASWELLGKKAESEKKS